MIIPGYIMKIMDSPFFPLLSQFRLLIPTFLKKLCHKSYWPQLKTYLGKIGTFIGPPQGMNGSSLDLNLTLFSSISGWDWILVFRPNCTAWFLELQFVRNFLGRIENCTLKQFKLQTFVRFLLLNFVSCPVYYVSINII